jgi:hypothetical protein
MSPLFGNQGKPFIDQARGDPEAARLRQAAGTRTGGWREVDAALAATREPARREFLVDAIALDCANLTWVDPWVREQPESPAARLMWGACTVQFAWKVRTGAAPQYVSADRMKGFHDWLTHAKDQLTAATTMAPDDSAPWVALLWCGVGLGIPIDEARGLWENASRRNPESELAALAYTTHIGPRWNGDADVMWTFVRGLVGREPAGSPKWALVPHGHIEQWVAERMAGNSAVHSSRYFEQAEVRRDITNAYSNYLGSPAKGRSNLEPQNRELFAVCFYLMGARDLLRKELEQIGPGIQTLPWGYLGSSLNAYKNVREAAGLK